MTLAYQAAPTHARAPEAHSELLLGACAGCGAEIWAADGVTLCSACESEQRPAETAFRDALAEFHETQSSRSRFARWGARVNAAWMGARGLRVRAEGEWR